MRLLAATTPPPPLAPRPAGRSARPRGQRAGFTLIEVLATLVLVAIVLPVAMKGISLSLGAAVYAKTSVQAAHLADAKLNELVALGQLTTGTSSGDFGSDYPDYHWTLQAVQADDTLIEVAIEVAWPWRGTERSVTLNTLLFTGSTTSTSTQQQ